MRGVLAIPCAATCAAAFAILLAGAAARAGDEKLPAKVMDALKAKFPKAEIRKWTREKEADKVVYDIEFKQEGRNFEADIFEDGSIHNWERAIEAKDLPAAVKKTLDAKYPKANLKEVMQVMAVKDGKDEVDGYEIVLTTADNRSGEVTIAPDGKLVEEEFAEPKKKDAK